MAFIKDTQEDFLEKAIKKHNNKYDYSKIKYEGSKIKIIIICLIHGEFEQLPNKHTFGRGCIKCGYIAMKKKQSSNNEEFIEKAKEIHGDKYFYNEVNYVTRDKKVTIKCKIHGDFEQTVNNHLSGYGCQECAAMSFNRYSKSAWIKHAGNRKGIFYIIQCSNDHETFYKLGITFNSIKRRYRDKNEMPYNYKVIKEIKSEDLDYIWELENSKKKIILKDKYLPLIQFNGCKSECFKNLELIIKQEKA